VLKENNLTSLSIDEIVHRLDLEEMNIVISKEIKKFNKLTTVVRGMDYSENIKSVSKELKTKLGTGGTIKDGQIILQGDHREAVKKLLVARGFKLELIDIL